MCNSNSPSPFFQSRIVELEKDALSFQEDLLQKERKWRREAEELRESVFRAERKEEEARKEEEDKWKTKLDEVVKVWL